MAELKTERIERVARILWADANTEHGDPDRVRDWSAADPEEWATWRLLAARIDEYYRHVAWPGVPDEGGTP